MKPRFQTLMQIAGPLLSLTIYLLLKNNGAFTPAAAATGGITFLCAFWWCTEAIPIPVTSLIPFVLFPMTGVLDYNVLAGAMGNKFILLFMGGFMLSRAAEKSETHLRIAHGMVKGIGTGTNGKLILGFMLATAPMLMPILAAGAVSSGLNPALYMIPAALSASCAFMLPIATPPNAIVFGGAEGLTIPKMARTGLWLNLAGVIIISLLCYFILDPQTGL